MGKSVKPPFSSSTFIAKFPLEIIHLDVWSASNSSISGLYYVLFVDNFSRYSWVYPIRFKYEVFAIFVKFKSLVENMFTSRIKTFQTNEGGEYTNNVFRAFLETHGINHRLTCPHHPEQNGLANASIIILLI